MTELLVYIFVDLKHIRLISIVFLVLTLSMTLPVKEKDFVYLLHNNLRLSVFWLNQKIRGVLWAILHFKLFFRKMNFEKQNLESLH